jgi:hypothetical protein
VVVALLLIVQEAITHCTTTSGRVTVTSIGMPLRRFAIPPICQLPKIAFAMPLKLCGRPAPNGKSYTALQLNVCRMSNEL